MKTQKGHSYHKPVLISAKIYRRLTKCKGYAAEDEI
jgi:hypothetical protein